MDCSQQKQRRTKEGKKRSKKKKKKSKNKENNIKLNSVRTPHTINIGGDSSLKELCSLINEEFGIHSCWNKRCTTSLRNNAHALFLYDRLEYSLSNAYGSAEYKVLLNPLMVLCHHPDCIKSSHPNIKLHQMFDLSRFIEHLMDHDDEIGLAMLNRVEAIVPNPFISREDLDRIHCSPYSLQPHLQIHKYKKVSEV